MVTKHNDTHVNESPYFDPQTSLIAALIADIHTNLWLQMWSLHTVGYTLPYSSIIQHMYSSSGLTHL